MNAYRRPSLAFTFVVAVAVVVAACGQVTTSEESPPARGVRAAGPATASLTQDAVCADADACEPTGAHAKHGAYACSVCHKVAGRLAFDKSGPAYKAGSPAPAFDATAKTCSNVACHGVPAGTFSYYFPGNEMDADGYPIPELKTVHYGGTIAAATPSWYATGSAACTACHGNPPVNGSDGANTWHSGFHANNQNVGAINPNACELCHNDMSLAYSTWTPVALSAVAPDGFWRAVQINPAAASRHANGTVDVKAKFVTQCFGCH